VNEQADFIDSHAPIDFDPERDEPWPMPVACIYCNSDNAAVRETYCNMHCASCIQRHFKKPAPAPKTLMQRIGRWLGGEDHE
jgi:hypothetical protein